MSFFSFAQTAADAVASANGILKPSKLDCGAYLARFCGMDKNMTSKGSEAAAWQIKWQITHPKTKQGVDFVQRIWFKKKTGEEAEGAMKQLIAVFYAIGITNEELVTLKIPTDPSLNTGDVGLLVDRDLYAIGIIQPNNYLMNSGKWVKGIQLGSIYPLFADLNDITKEESVGLNKLTVHFTNEERAAKLADMHKKQELQARKLKAKKARESKESKSEDVQDSPKPKARAKKDKADKSDKPVKVSGKKRLSKAVEPETDNEGTDAESSEPAINLADDESDNADDDDAAAESEPEPPKVVVKAKSGGTKKVKLAK